MDLELHPMGKPRPCDVADCTKKTKCMLHGDVEDGVEKDFTPRMTPKLEGEIVVICHMYETAEAPETPKE